MIVREWSNIKYLASEGMNWVMSRHSHEWATEIMSRHSHEWATEIMPRHSHEWVI